MAIIDNVCLVCGKDPCKCSVKSNKQSYSTGVHGGYTHRLSFAAITKTSIKVIVKTNYQLSGKQKNGSFVSNKDIAKKATASQKYINRESAQEKELNRNMDLSNLHDMSGKQLTKQELKNKQSELSNGVSGVRRGVVSPDPKLGLTAEDVKNIAIASLVEFKYKSIKEFDGVVAVHTDTENTHAHFTVTGDKRSIKWSKQDLNKFKAIVSEKTNEVLRQKEKEKKLFQFRVKTSDTQQTNYRSL